MKSTLWITSVAIFGLVRAVPRPQTADITESLTSLIISPTVTGVSSTRLSASTSAVASNDACAQLASRVRSLPAVGPTVPAKAAWDCLQAVPYDPDTALAWVQSLRPYIRWQSTVAYLKDPPDGYQLPPYDIYAKYDEIVANITNSRYSNQYELEFAIYNLFQQAHDGHLSYQPNLVSRIVGFGRPFALVAFSSDGRQVPKSYVYGDVLLSYNTTNFQPSAVTEINGEEVNAHLERFSLNAPVHDRDAMWNDLFYSLAHVSLGAIGTGPGTFSGGGRGDVVYPNATTTLRFENGTTRTYENIARLLIPFTNITSAQDLYRRFVNPNTIPPATSISGVSNTNATPPGYPEPVLRARLNLASGYYLDNEYSDVAVLSLPSFINVLDSTNVTMAFLDRAKAAGKTKLIIDLSANAGGIITFGFQLFVKLFPNIFPYMGTRFRATEVFDIIGQTVSDYSNGTSRLLASYVNTTNGTVRNPYYTFFNGNTPFPYASDVDEDYRNFPSWDAKFGPHEYNNDNFTSIIRYNLSEEAVYINYTRVNTSSQPMFAPENIILLTDGYCASTCSNFVEMMTQQAGVKTVVVGGRPGNGSMQAVGGTRGSNNWQIALVLSLSQLAYQLAVTTRGLAYGATLFLSSQLGEYLGGLGSNPELPLRRGGYANSINVRDNIRRDDTDQVPLQFKYEAADCRVFFTKDMTVDMSALWEDVADVTWGDGDCVAGNIQGANNNRTTKRSAKERMEKRSARQRQIPASELDALAEGVNLWTDHNLDMSVDGMVMP